jgi:hypothetical protein
MEDFNTLKKITPDWLTITEAITLDYPIRSISIENIGDGSGLVLGKELQSGLTLTFDAGTNGYYPPRTWFFEPNGTTFQILINK